MLYLLLLCVIALQVIIIFKEDEEEMDMAMVYVSLIIKGKRTYSSVPATIKPQVREILIDLELEYLIDEE